MNANRATSKLPVLVLGCLRFLPPGRLVFTAIPASGQRLSKLGAKAFVRFPVCLAILLGESDRTVTEVVAKELELPGASKREAAKRFRVNVWMVSLISPRDNILLRAESHREVRRCPPDYRRSSRRSITAREAASLDQFRPDGFDALKLRVSTGALHEVRGPSHRTYPGMRFTFPRVRVRSCMPDKIICRLVARYRCPSDVEVV